MKEVFIDPVTPSTLYSLKNEPLLIELWAIETEGDKWEPSSAEEEMNQCCDQCWTTGLGWNLGKYKVCLLIMHSFSLDGQEMKIGGLVSTCNLLKSYLVPHPQDYTVTIKCTHKVVFTFSHKLCNVTM